MKSKTLITIIVLIGATIICLYFNWSKIFTPRIISESEAIILIKERFPELSDYPSDNLPPTSIETEIASNGWYLAFIQEGSGVPIIDVRCFLVKNDKSITEKDYIPKEDTSIGEFSAKDCKLVE